MSDMEKVAEVLRANRECVKELHIWLDSMIWTFKSASRIRTIACGRCKTDACTDGDTDDDIDHDHDDDHDTDDDDD